MVEFLKIWDREGGVTALFVGGEGEGAAQFTLSAGFACLPPGRRRRTSRQIWHPTPTNYHRRRPYRVEYTGSLLTSEVKRRRARLVLGWGTAREDLRVLSAFFIFQAFIF